MLLTVEFAGWNLRPWHDGRVVHLSERETSLKETQHMLVNLRFCNKTTAHCLGKITVSITEATLHVGTGNHALGSGMGGVRRCLV